MKELKKIEIPVTQLQQGMYVSDLDCGWEKSPFLLQGFIVTSDKIRLKLQEICQHVSIDTSRSIDLKKSMNDPTENTFQNKNDGAYRASAKPPPVHKNRYKKDAQTAKQEVHVAKKSYSVVQENLTGLLSNVDKKSIANPKRMDAASQLLVTSAISYPSSLPWLAMVQDRDNRAYDHALRTSTWALLCGRHIGLSKPDLKHLAIGTMLKDTGRIHDALQRKQSLSDQKSNSDIDTQLTDYDNLDPKVIDIIENFRERFNGTGKPRGLVGEEIPLLARVTAIATAYDFALNPVSEHREQMSPSQAAAMIYNQRGRAFQEELAILFIEAIGTYPTGTIMQLDTGEVAVVVSQDENSRLRPHILIVTDDTGQPIQQKRLVQLGKESDDDEGEVLNAKVMRDLSSQTINFNLAELMEEYEVIKAKAKAKQKPTQLERFKSFWRKK